MTIHEDMRTLARVREVTRLTGEERAHINAAFRKRRRTAEQDPCRFDYLGGRDRLQILPRDEMLILPGDGSRAYL